MKRVIKRVAVEKMRGNDGDDGNELWDGRKPYILKIGTINLNYITGHDALFSVLCRGLHNCLLRYWFRDVNQWGCSGT